MQINKVQSPNFGKCILDQSALKAFKRIPVLDWPQISEKAAEIRNTKYWDLVLKKHPKLGEGRFYPFFIRKGEQEVNIWITDEERDLCGIPSLIRREGSNVSFVADSPERIYTNEIPFSRFHQLKFANEEKAQKAQEILKIPYLLNNIKAFNQAVEITKILEESSEYKISSQKKSLKFWKKFISYFI